MVSALDSGASCPGSSPGRGHCVVFLGKTLTVPLSQCLSHSASLYCWAYCAANCWGNLTTFGGSDLRWTSIPSRGSIQGK